MTVAFLVWYFAFVLAAVFAPAWMAQPVGNINRGIVFGLLQFVSTGLITWLYVRHANNKLDPWPPRSVKTWKAPADECHC